MVKCLKVESYLYSPLIELMVNKPVKFRLNNLKSKEFHNITESRKIVYLFKSENIFCSLPIVKNPIFLTGRIPFNQSWPKNLSFP